ncbi:MAG TPA: GWxTD domain-containing protein [Gemmatimonadales bacterium]|nr:GWxTD domain-containing protein [Gemmatimonadales bacterium]
MKQRAVAVAAVLAVLAAASAAAQSLEIGVTRFYRSATRQTIVDGFVRVPFALLDTLTRGANGVAAYRIDIVVRDSANLQLVSQSWSKSVPARLLASERSSALEHFTFAASPGTYALEVAVHDSASGRITRGGTSLTTFAQSPVVSDLLLATGMRMPSGADTTLGPGEMHKGGAIVEAAVRPLLTPRQAQLGYYIEWYGREGRQAAETTGVSVRVTRADGSPVVTTPAQRVPFQAGGGVTRAMVDLAGLPPGEYGFEVIVQGKDTTVSRRGPFRMAGLETVAVADVPAADIFESKSEAALDTLYAPLIYLMTSDETGIYSTLTVEGKRTYLRRFWARRDPSPGTADNEVMAAFYARIGEANRRFREGGAAEIPGWRTDRGRIFIKYGPPNEVMQRPQAGSTLPYEVWKYSRGRALKYVFMDFTQFGNYSLIWTDDRREPSRPNWESLLGPEALEEVQRF